jgi:hypothetical protein
MRFPSKVTSYNDSIIAKFSVVLKELSNTDMTPETLYSKIKNKVNGISEFMEIIVCLYALNEVELINEEVLHYAKKY